MDTNKHKFNILDLIIIIVLVLAIAGAAWFFQRSKGSSEGTQSISYVVEVTNVTQDLKDSVQIGDTVIDGVKKTQIGTITNVEVINQTTDTYSPDLDTIVKTEKPGYYTLQITCQADADVSDSAISVNSYRIAIGNTIYFQSKHFAAEGYCIKINTGEVQ